MAGMDDQRTDGHPPPPLLGLLTTPSEAQQVRAAQGVIKFDGIVCIGWLARGVEGRRWNGVSKVG